MTDQIEIPRPHVPYGPAGIPEALADADYLDSAARNISGGYAIGGYNVTATVIQLLHDTATALRREHESESNADVPQSAALRDLEDRAIALVRQRAVTEQGEPMTADEFAHSTLEPGRDCGNIRCEICGGE